VVDDSIPHGEGLLCFRECAAEVGNIRKFLIQPDSKVFGFVHNVYIFIIDVNSWVCSAVLRAGAFPQQD